VWSAFITTFKLKHRRSSGGLTFSPSFGPPSRLVVASRWYFACFSSGFIPSRGLVAISRLLFRPVAIRRWPTTSASTGCMGNDKRLFENLVLARTAQRVGGISKGLAIEGKEMLVLTINNDNGKPHKLRIPNGLYLPGLRTCLLSPQHWAQEAGDNYPLPNGTRMENTANNCKLLWGQGMFLKTIPFDNGTNTPIFYTSPLTLWYCAFVHTFQAFEALFFSREHVPQQPGHRWLDRGSPLDPAQFVAEEIINLRPYQDLPGWYFRPNTTSIYLTSRNHGLLTLFWHQIISKIALCDIL